jgi:hypothetical protein
VLAAEAIAREGDALMVSWLRRVRQEQVLGPTETIVVRFLINDVSSWLMELVSVLRYGPEDVSGRAEIRDKIRRHIQEAHQRGIGLAQIIKQFEILRDEVWMVLERAGLEHISTTDVFALGRAVNTALDGVLVQIAQVYSSSTRPLVGRKKDA